MLSNALCCSLIYELMSRLVELDFGKRNELWIVVIIDIEKNVQSIRMNTIDLFIGNRDIPIYISPIPISEAIPESMNDPSQHSFPSSAPQQLPLRTLHEERNHQFPL